MVRDTFVEKISGTNGKLCTEPVSVFPGSITVVMRVAAENVIMARPVRSLRTWKAANQNAGIPVVMCLTVFNQIIVPAYEQSTQGAAAEDKIFQMPGVSAKNENRQLLLKR